MADILGGVATGDLLIGGQGSQIGVELVVLAMRRGNTGYCWRGGSRAT